MFKVHHTACIFSGPILALFSSPHVALSYHHFISAVHNHMHRFSPSVALSAGGPDASKKRGGASSMHVVVHRRNEMVVRKCNVWGGARRTLPLYLNLRLIVLIYNRIHCCLVPSPPHRSSFSMHYPAVCKTNTEGASRKMHWSHPCYARRSKAYRGWDFITLAPAVVRRSGIQ